MKVPYNQSVHGKEEEDAVVQVIRTNTALGERTKEAEALVSELFGKKHGIMVNSGSSANRLALDVCDMEPGDEVITPLLTFSTVVAPILQKGLVPVFVDVEPGTYVVNPDAVEQAITPRTRALMIPSLLGNIPNMERLHEIATKHHLHFIEDSCDTLGATYKGRPTGNYSDFTTTSFYGSHIVNGMGGGGMVMTQSDKLAERLMILRGWGRHSSLFGEKEWSEQLDNRFHAMIDDIEYDNKFVFSEIGHNFLPLETSAAFLTVQLKLRFPGFAQLRKKRFAQLMEFFRQYEEFFMLPKQTPHTETNWLAFPVTIHANAPFKRKAFMLHLERNGIQTRPVFTGNILRQPAFRNIPHVSNQSHEHVDHVMRNGVILGCHQGLSDEQFAYMQDKISEFLTPYK